MYEIPYLLRFRLFQHPKFSLLSNKLKYCDNYLFEFASISIDVSKSFIGFLLISILGQIIAHLGDQLKTELMHCLPIFLDRLKNEITRLTAVKALISIAKSDLKIELKPILAESMPILAGFLRKNQRALKMSSLTLLDTVVKNYSTQITDKNLEPVSSIILNSRIYMAIIIL